MAIDSEKTTEELEQPPAQRLDANQWREKVWGQLPVRTTTDPNFRPTHPIPTTHRKKKLIRSTLSEVEAERLLNKDYNTCSLPSPAETNDGPTS